MALIHEQLFKVHKTIDPIKKDQKNTFQGYNFRGIDDVYNYLHGIMVENQILTVPEITESHYEHYTNDKGKIAFKVYYVVKYTLMASDGSTVVMSMAGEGQDSSDKTTGKALSNAHKYALLQLFMIPTEEVKDSDGQDNLYEDLKKKAIDAINKADLPGDQKSVVLQNIPKNKYGAERLQRWADGNFK